MAIGVNRVQVYKDEDPTLGGSALDVVPGPAPIRPQQDATESAGHYFQDESNRDETVYIERDGQKLRFIDQENPTGYSLSEIATGGAGLTESSHALIDSLVHELRENSFVELTMSGENLTSVVIWDSPSKTKKIRDAVITYSGDDVSTVVSKQYGPDGIAVLETLTSTFTYSGEDLVSVQEVLT